MTRERRQRVEGGRGQPERRKDRVGQVPPIYSEFDAFDGRVRGDARETGGIEQMRVSTRQMSDERCNNVRIHFVSGCFIFDIFFVRLMARIIRRFIEFLHPPRSVVSRKLYPNRN